MPITVTCREFNQKASQMLQLSQQEPVFITKWGKIVGVLSSYQAYQQREAQSLAEAFASGHAAGDLDDALDADLARIRQQSARQRPNDWGQ
ncbi:type II toxin-antitoxin system Phd/YefM family antitoxin [Allofranklinella schreckenbergeri]|uniref:Type II toxin-antitoxin system Phd/YefM family antitoxin n=1 Tax=Allofranklinella schreckenbergeri TaxID=1076744 RepID=A0A3M6QD22_9BURK|nr:type II toxin-antitoxin system Phd/YefM family antitoxin [Allofranklinella schreckenbergeri]RMW95393.1 type II toxin-antitoxin system Phd/YefM family antitoxin [Allofranklinella schreckenbergeri]RMX01018.1 type II toxin-antitoxin system Phd/YefM family antitoxin [Allofranklinella schreckenbergeri]